MQLLCFAGSNSSTSINLKLATYASQKISKHLSSKNIDSVVKTLELADFDMPIYSPERQRELSRPPEPVERFLNLIKESDAIVLSLAEHNGSYSSGFKNLMDWTSVYEGNFFQNKPMLLMATSPGARGAKSVLETAKTRFPFHAAQIKTTFSLPEFHKNFSESEGIKLNEKHKELEDNILLFIDSFLHV